MDTGYSSYVRVKDYGTNIKLAVFKIPLSWKILQRLALFVKNGNFSYWIIIIIKQQRFSSHCSNIHHRGTGKAKKSSGISTSGMYTNTYIDMCKWLQMYLYIIVQYIHICV